MLPRHDTPVSNGMRKKGTDSSLSPQCHCALCSAPDQLVETLRQQIARLEEGRRRPDAAPVSSGCNALDELLPERGFHRGTLVEWLLAGEGCGGETLALLAAREACQPDGILVVLDQSREFYPPAAARLGIRLEDAIVVQATNSADNLWALDQALRCTAVAAVLAWPVKLDGRTFRRLQLAAEQGGSLGLLIRPARASGEPSWADLRLRIEPLPAETRAGARRLRLQLLRCRGGNQAVSIDMELDDETHPLPLAPRLAAATALRRAARA